MARYIDAEVVLKKMKNWHTKERLMDCVENTPTADVAEVKRGEWLLEREPNGKPYCFHCSVCDDDFHHIGITSTTDYCPNCGAKMDDKRKEDDT